MIVDWNRSSSHTHTHTHTSNDIVTLRLPVDREIVGAYVTSAPNVSLPRFVVRPSSDDHDAIEPVVQTGEEEELWEN
jgi:hypothetical protein